MLGSNNEGRTAAMPKNLFYDTEAASRGNFIVAVKRVFDRCTWGLKILRSSRFGSTFRSCQ